MNKTRRTLKLLPALLMIIALSGCVMGPDYQQPATIIPVQYKNDTPWKEATPKDTQVKGEWWTVYNDPVLNSLEQQASASNQSLQAAFARLSQAQASLGISRSDQLPRLDLNASATRQRTAADLAITGTTTGNQYKLPLVLSYEVDLWAGSSVR